MDRFKAMLLEISDKLGSDNLAKLKFLCKDRIGKKKTEEIASGIDLFQYLIERADIGPYDTELLRTLLTSIDQIALIQIIENYENRTIPSDLPDENEQRKIDCAIEVIVNNLGQRWRQFGRKLGISDARLDGIREKHQCNLEEQVRELFREWKRMQKSKANVKELVKALRDCNQNYTADLVEQELQNNFKP